MNIEEDRNLLFGVLAMQLRGVSPAQLAQCASAWSSDRTRPLSEFLVESGFLNPADREFLNALVDEAIRAHAGDVDATLADFGGAECIERTFQGRIPYLASDDSTIEHTVRGIRLGELDNSVHAVHETPGRYTSVSEHARGGMGRVLLVYDEHLGREIAMKELLPYASSEGDTLTPRRHVMTIVSRFLQEARITGQLEHPSIVPVYELGRHPDGSLYYTMKLVRGRTLSDVLRSTSTLADRLAVLPNYLDLCQAIAYAHSREVIHRDIKPSNVMVGEFGETVVLDWGLAKALHDKSERPDNLAETLRALKLSPSVEPVQTSDGQILGTPVYMPPEQARGELDEVDERSDVYSLGAVLYELLTGNRPYDRGKPAEILQKVISQLPPAVLKVEPSAPQELVAVCERAMARNQQDRYKDAKELVADIERFQTGALVSAYRYSLGEYLRRWVRRHKTVAATAAAAAMLIVAISLVYVFSLKHANTLLAQSRQEEQNQRVQAEGARDLAEQRQYVSTIRLANEYLNSRLMNAANEVLWSAPEAYRNWEWGHLLNRSKPEVFSLPGCMLATYSPDGDYIATLSAENGVQIWKALAGRPVATMADPNPDRMTALRFSPDGTLLAAGGMSGTVKVWRVESGKLLSELGPRTGVISGIEFTSDSKRLAVVASDGNTELWNLAIGTKSRTLEGGFTKTWRAEFSSDESMILTAHDDDTVKVWDGGSEAPAAAFAGRQPHFRPGTHDIILVRNSEAIAYNAESRQETGFRVALPNPLRNLHYNRDGSLLVVVGTDGISVVFDGNDGSIVATLNHGQPVVDAAFSPDSSLVVTFTDTGSFKVWYLPDGVEVANFTGHSSRVGLVEFSPDNTHYLSMGLDHNVYVWNARKPLSVAIVANTGGPIANMSVASGNRRIALGASTGEIHVVDLETATGVATFASFAAQPFPRHAISPDGKFLCTATDGFTPLIWRVDDRAVALRIEETSAAIGGLVFSPDSTHLAIGFRGGGVHVFDASTGRAPAPIEGHTHDITAIAFLPDSARLVTASQDGTVAIWDVDTGSRIMDLPKQADAVRAIATSPDGSRVMTVTSNNTISSWDTSSGEGGPTVASPAGASSITYLADTGRIATGTPARGSVTIWDLANGQELISLDGHGQTLTGVCYNSREAALLTASLDGTVRAWRAAPWRLEDLPDSPAGSWPERYSAYRNAVFSSDRFPVPYIHATEFVVAAPRNIVSGLLGAILTACTGNGATRVAGASVVDASLAETLQSMGIRAGDRLDSINEISFDTPEIAEALEATRHGIEQGSVAAARLRLNRSGMPVEFTYHVVDVVQKREHVELPEAQLSQIVTQHQSMLRRNRANILQINEELHRRISGFPRESGYGLGFSVVGGTTPEEREALSTLHIQPGDLLVGIDGAPVTSIEDLESILSQVAERVRSGTFSSTTIVVMRGAFQRVEVNVSVL